MGAKTEFTETEDKRKNIKETKQTVSPQGKKKIKKMHVHLRNKGVNRFRDKTKLPSPEQPCVGYQECIYTDL